MLYFNKLFDWKTTKKSYRIFIQNSFLNIFFYKQMSLGVVVIFQMYQDAGKQETIKIKRR